jgi:hypothetical protein
VATHVSVKGENAERKRKRGARARSFYGRWARGEEETKLGGGPDGQGKEHLPRGPAAGG